MTGGAGTESAGGADGGEETVGRGGAPDTSLGGAAAGVPNVAGATDGGAAGVPNEGGAPALAGSGGKDGGECGAVESQQALATGTHVTACSEIAYATNPPSSGPHYPSWADYGVYDFALPRGYWMHNLEHGSVVVSYNCADGCAAELAAAKSWLTGLEPDAACAGQTPRVLLVPDPLLDVRWAASSWGFTLRAECFDAEAFSDFYVSHAGQLPAPEAAICVTGSDFRTDGACGVR